MRRRLCLVCLVALLPACSTLGIGAPAGPSAPFVPGQTMRARLIEDPASPGTCRIAEPWPDPLSGRGGATVRWVITNTCHRPAVVTVSRIREKRTLFGGVYPFMEKPLTLVVPDDGLPHDLVATVMTWANVPASARGLHIYQYRLTIQPGGMEALELIVVWP